MYIHVCLRYLPPKCPNSSSKTSSSLPALPGSPTRDCGGTFPLRLARHYIHPSSSCLVPSAPGHPWLWVRLLLVYPRNSRATTRRRPSSRDRRFDGYLPLNFPYPTDRQTPTPVNRTPSRLFFLYPASPLSVSSHPSPGPLRIKGRATLLHPIAPAPASPPSN